MHYFLSIFSRGWLLVALLGTTLFVVLDKTLKYTQDISFLPTLMILGAFVVPVSFATYFYHQEYILDRNIHGGSLIVMISVVFLIGGVMGTVIAGVLESQIYYSSIGAFFLLASIIEEAAKLIFPLFIFASGKYRSEVDGIVLGIASGLGFAAFETLGYSLLTYITTDAHIGDVEQILIIRGLLSPLGHAAWTGLICGAIWHFQGKRVKMVIAATLYFALAIALHFLWNTAVFTGEALIKYPAFVAIGGVGLFLVFWHLHHARRKHAVVPEQPAL